MTEEVPSARPGPWAPTPSEQIEQAVIPPAGPEVAPPVDVSPPGPIPQPSGQPLAPPPDPVPAGFRAVHVALMNAETAVALLHTSHEIQQGTANPERLGSALTLLNQARQRFEEWLSQFV